MGMATDGLSYWQTETEKNELLDITIGDLFNRRVRDTPDRQQR